MLNQNVINILSEIKNGNNLGEKITLVGAIKTVDIDKINQAIESGLSVVAENHVQEFRERTNLLNKNAEQQFIGHLQTNKVKYIVGNVSLIQSVDSANLAQEISKRALKLGITQDILLEINIAKEQTKTGFSPDTVFDDFKRISDYPNINIVGLMAMFPNIDDHEYIASLCKKMRSFYDEFVSMGNNFKYLSMGMSSDYKIAIKNGSNMIRLGSSLFGARNYGGKQ